MTDAEANKTQEFIGDLPTLKSKLEELRKKKEEWFQRKEDLKKEMSDLIGKIKGLKKSGSSGKSISELKTERDKYNKEVRELIGQFKEANKEKTSKLSKVKVKVNPSELKSQIEKLERQIEIEAVDFDQEKKIMRKINELRKQQEESKGISGLFGKLDNLSKQIDEKRTKAEESHGQLRTRFSESKKGYESFKDISKRIKEVKVTQEEAFKNFAAFKKEFNDLSNAMREKFKQIDRSKKERAKSKEVQVQSRQKDDENKLKEKVRAIEEKLKKKKVLTTEDLIAFQGLKEE